MKVEVQKQTNSQDTKDRIYCAAVEILRTKGYAYLTVSNVCKLAGVSNGTFFYHFKTKDELLSFYTYDYFAQFREEHSFGEAVRGKSFEEKIIIFYDYWADYMNELGLEFFSNFYHTKNSSLDVRLWNRREPVTIWNYPGDCLSAAETEGFLKEGTSVIHCAEVLGTLMKGIAFDWCLSNGAFDMHDRIKEVMIPYLDSICK